MNPRIIDKTTIIKDAFSTSSSSLSSLSSSSLSLSSSLGAKPFIVRIPQIQTKSPLNTDSGKVVIVKSTPSISSGTATATSLTNNVHPPGLLSVATSAQSGTKSFSVVKLADGQIVLVPTNLQPQQPVILNENGISRIIKAPATSPPHPTGVISTIKRVTKEQNTSRISTIQITNLSSSSSNFKSPSPLTSPQERRLRPIAPAPSSLSTSTSDLLNSLLLQQQQQLNAVTDETLLRFDPTASVLLGEDDPLPVISETVTLDSNGSSLRHNHKRKLDSLPIEQKTSLPVVSSVSVEQKPKAIRKTTVPTDEKSTIKARLENKATSIIKDARKKMTPRQVPVPAASTVKLPLDTKIQKTPVKRPTTSVLPPKIDPEEGIRYGERVTHFVLFFFVTVDIFFLKNENL
jgi:hypothetical protein